MKQEYITHACVTINDQKLLRFPDEIENLTAGIDEPEQIFLINDAFFYQVIRLKKLINF